MNKDTKRMIITVGAIFCLGAVVASIPAIFFVAIRLGQWCGLLGA